jgi:phosphoribosyl-ATP pyrophosphohydrolase/phosphoribosyl-AMP cyclohydrolase
MNVTASPYFPPKAGNNKKHIACKHYKIAIFRRKQMLNNITEAEINAFAAQLKFDTNGLIPAIVQQKNTGKVLMLAYMNRESLKITIAEKRTCFYSRSRSQLWRKGESSGNIQHVHSINADCDGDTLLVQVSADGPACHTGNLTCFFNVLGVDDEKTDANTSKFSLNELYKLIEGRKTEKKENSYTSYLFEKGREKILKKLGEECTEVVIGAMKNDNEETVFELADLCYHAMVLMAECGIAPKDVLSELEKRHVVDKKVKQETLK